MFIKASLQFGFKKRVISMINIFSGFFLMEQIKIISYYPND